ncbi:MAG: 4-hydroxy-3-methylbut-2-enyl diphosphate reductase [Candidatus Izemoplasmatales bacterium]|nr:4-hydroxy-3-methylbut-2-enyl diphosphate reductase [Candidatus Izemoplasmatales bacterium]MDD3864772.1 4-hydroxy-3-methylbut-2-enyl diphosphate reductase [Candidatus Izemoplasmatales bacterium]
MKVIPITPRGYCPGVVNAINSVNKVLSDPSYPRPLYLLGMIVHNQFVVDYFKTKGIIVIDQINKTRLQMLDSIHQGTVIITAHGVGDVVIEKILDKGLTYVDATCKDVYKTHNLIKNYLASGYQIIYIGKENHPETEGVLSIDKNIILIESERDARLLEKTVKPIFVTNQTTFSIREIEPIIKVIKQQYPYAIISEEICNSTRIRQEAVINQNHDVDLCLVVGDIHSNNTINLVKLSRQYTHVKTVRIASSDDLKPELLKGVKTVSVTSGASTPTEVTAKVISVLENY